jgi:hypothetical protein
MLSLGGNGLSLVIFHDLVIYFVYTLRLFLLFIWAYTFTVFVYGSYMWDYLRLYG